MMIKFARVDTVSADTCLVEMIQMTLIEDPFDGEDGQDCAEPGCINKIRYDSIGEYWYHLPNDAVWAAYDVWNTQPNHQPRPKS